MLTKNPQRAVQLVSARKNWTEHSCVPGTAINEPRPEWVPLASAPFYFSSNGYICKKKWADAQRAHVEQMISRSHGGPPNPDYPELIGLSLPEWSFSANKNALSVSITAMGVSTNIAPGFVSVHPGRRDWVDLDRWLIVGSSNKILIDPEWDWISPDERIAAQWHRRLLAHLFSFWRLSFVQAIKDGAAHIMARKNTVLAPFERIAWDQWQFFKLNEDEERSVKIARNEIWCDPRPFSWSRDAPSTATGPAGERLYGICIASDVNRPESEAAEETAEQKCQRWLMELVHQFPERSPKPRDNLAGDAMSLFQGLSRKGFDRALFTTQVLTGIRTWSKPGRRQKSST